MMKIINLQLSQQYPIYHGWAKMKE